MRVLIVGCGYVGLPLGRELVARGHEVWGLRRSAGAAAELLAAGIRPVAADIAERASLDALDPCFDAVVNCAASGGGGIEDYRRTYLEGNRNVIDWLAASPPRRFVYTSSTGVYGQTDGSVVDETSPTAPDAATGQVLVAAEQLLMEVHASRGWPAIILRLAGIYGPGRGYWLRQFLAGEARIEGDGSRVLNMIHRDDVVGATLAALAGGQPGKIYNVVDDEPVTQLELMTWLAARLNRPLPPALPAETASNRKRGLTSKRVSNARLRQDLNWAPQYPTFREGFAAELEKPGNTL